MHSQSLGAPSGVGQSGASIERDHRKPWGGGVARTAHWSSFMIGWSPVVDMKFTQASTVMVSNERFGCLPRPFMRGSST